MYMNVHVDLEERVIVSRRGVPVLALEPGDHRLWGFSWSVEARLSTKTATWSAPEPIRAVLPAAWYAERVVARDERVVLMREGRPVAFLRPGLHRYWTLDPTVAALTYKVDEPMPELTDELVAILPRNEYTDVVVCEHQRGLRYVQGRLVEVLAPGQYAYWSHPRARVNVAIMDMRRVDLTLAGQELMTKDKVTLRLTLTVQYLIEDPARLATAVSDVRDAIYLMVQLAARAFVSSATLDELLESRDAMTRALEAETVEAAKVLGVRIERLGIKDVVLPGEMKTLLNRVIEAEKEAAANVILRREETAATRSLANTARMMAEQPILLRLKELESLKEIAAEVGEVRLVLGGDGLDKLLPAALLTGSGAR